MKNMKRTALKHSHRLALLACIMGAQLSCSWFTGEAFGMAIMRRAPLHILNNLPIAWESPVWRTLAGYPNATGTNDGPGISARFSNPSGIAADPAGNIYVADSGNCVIRKISPAGLVSTLAGQPGQWGSQDGPATNALFRFPTALALDTSGNLYLADNSAIRKLSAVGSVTTIAGQPDVSGYRDGAGTNALFGYSIGGLALDTNGNLYVADSGNWVVRRISPAGVVSTVAGQPGIQGYVDDIGTNALFGYPIGGLALDTNGDLYVADTGNNVIRKISPAGVVTTWVGQPGKEGYRDGQGTNAWFWGPSGLTIDSQGNLYVTECYNRCVRKISPQCVVSTLGGDAWVWADPYYGAEASSRGHRDGIGPFATFSWPGAAALDSSGHLVVVDSSDSTIRYGSLASEPRPRILSQPRSQTVQEGTNVTFSVVAQGTAPLTYQWLANGAVLSGATGTSLALRSVLEGDSGEYCVAVSDGVGYVLSFRASLQVCKAKTVSPAPLNNWRPVASLALQHIHGLAHGNGCYVAIGGADDNSSEVNGLVVTSTNGEHWVKQPPISPAPLNSVAFGNGLFVIVGDGGAVLTSTNGLAWEAQTLTAEGMPDLSGITFDQGLFVAVSDDANGSIWTSPDGRNWTNRGIDFGVSFRGVSAAEGKFIAVGNTIVVSTNGLDWEPGEVPANYLGQETLLEHIAFANGIFLAAQDSGGLVAASTNGLDWRDITPTNGLSLGRVTGGNDRFVAVEGNSGGVSLSTDGVVWSAPVVTNSDGQTCSDPHLCFKDGLFVATGDNGLLFTSPDGNSWSFHQQQHVIPFVPEMMINVAGRYFAAGGAYGIATSTNGSDWEIAQTPCYARLLLYGGGSLVAIGTWGEIFSSEDGGATWTDRSGHLDQSCYCYLNQMTYGRGVFVGVGYDEDKYGSTQGRVLSSSNLVNWVVTDLAPTNALYDVTYGSDLFVAILNNHYEGGGGILTSRNGFSWNTTATFPGWLYAVAYGNGRFVIASGTGVITSADGITWKQHDVAGMNNGDLSSIVFGNGLFLTTVNSGLWSSADGITWSQCAPDVSLRIVVVGEGCFLGFGGRPCIAYQSGPIERVGNPRWLPNLDLEWTVTGAPHLNYRIEFSEDLLSWRTLTRVTNARSTSPFIDPEAATRASRFYRVVTE